MNNVFLIGNLVRDPELNETATGVFVVNFTVAVNEKYKKSDGTLEQKASFFDCEAWDSGGKLIADKFHKGDPILVQGKLRNKTWETKDGEKRSKVTIRVSNFEFLPRRKAEPVAEETSTVGNDYLDDKSPF